MKPTSGERFDSAIVQRAMVETVTNLGQFSHQERLDLEYAVYVRAGCARGKVGHSRNLKLYTLALASTSREVARSS